MQHPLKILLLLVLYAPFALRAQDQGTTTPAGHSADDVAAKLQNPLANMISVPLQSNFNLGFGPEEKMQYVLNVQPIVPVMLSSKMMLLNRPILPIISDPSPYDQFGIGDLNYTGWLAPAQPGKVTWGAGPQLSLPIASPDGLGFNQWAVGPSAVVVMNHGKWIYGGMFSNIFGMGENAQATESVEVDDVNFFSSQVFLSHMLPKGRSVTFAPLITANWNAPDGEQWTVPLGAGVSQVVPAGKLFINLGLQYYQNVVHPTLGPTSSIRFVISTALPK